MLVYNRPVSAQAMDTAQLANTLNNMLSAYKQKPVAFTIRYTFSSELKPSMALDSLTGEMMIEGDNCDYKVATQETISTGKYNIVLFKDDKLMYVTRPVTGMNSGLLQQVGTLVSRSGVQSAEIIEKGNQKAIRIKFKANGPCRDMEIIIDKTTGYLSSIRYAMKMEMLMPNQGENGPAPDPALGEYALVQTDFGHYKVTKADAARWDEHTYFQREDKVFVPTSAYSEFKIFEGSPNL